MIQIGSLSNARAAIAFHDYLKSKGIYCKIQQTSEEIVLFVEHEKDANQAHQEFLYFVENPNDKKYLQASWNYGSTTTKLNYGKPSSQLLATFLAGCGPLTLSIFIICIAIFGAWNLGYANNIYASLGFFGSSPNEALHQFWRIFTPTLLHFSAMHIIFNLLWWWYLGGKIEKRLGIGTLAILLIIGGTLPNIIQFMMTGPNFGGLSGVVYALAGYTWVMGNRKPDSGIFLPSSYMGFMMIWLLLGFTPILGFSMANGAHVGGLLVGLIQGVMDSRKR